jgi:hypothetical protein
LIDTSPQCVKNVAHDYEEEKTMVDFREKFSAYRASKKVLIWSWVGVAALTMVIGFTWGGWVTGGSATERAETAAEKAVAALAADVCFNRFMAAPDAQASLAAFNEESAYSRAKYVEEGGWTTLGGRDKPIRGASKLCADQLADAKVPAPAATVGTPLAAAEAVVN